MHKDHTKWLVEFYCIFL